MGSHEISKWGLNINATPDNWKALPKHFFRHIWLQMGVLLVKKGRASNAPFGRPS